MPTPPDPNESVSSSATRGGAGNAASRPPLHHRRDIDGLRALAVVPVILYHAGATYLPGGFVGVDIFFVISGFLITALLLRELESSGGISIVDFYERRARRILPALLLVMGATCLLSVWLLVPHQMVDFGQSVVAALAMLSNVLFFLESGYFEPEAANKPLLHTWSLAVEEQYYVVFPLALVLLYRLRSSRTGRVLGIALLASFAYSLSVTPTASAWGFYSLPTRAWELLAGAALASHMSRLASSAAGPSKVDEAGSVIGLLLILVAMLRLGENGVWPSPWTLLPVLGSVLLIRCNVQPTLVGRLLSHPLPVGIGLISYSAYLWHQPLLAFWRINVPEPSSTGFVVAFFSLVMALSYLSWRFVEIPFRDRHRLSRRALLSLLTPVTLVIGGFAVTAIASDGFMQMRRASLPPAQRALVFDRAELEAISSNLWKSSLDAATAPFEPARAGERVLLLGDSMAQDLYATLAQAGKTEGSRQYRWAQLDETCLAALNASADASSMPDGEGSAGVEDIVRTVIDPCEREAVRLTRGTLWHTADRIVLSASWTEESMEELDALLVHIARRGQEAALVNLLEIQEMSSILMQRGLDTARMGHYLHTRVRPRTRSRNADLARVAAHRGAVIVDKFDCFCDAAAERCDLVDVGAERVYIWDHIHLTPDGRERFAQCLGESERAI